MELIGKTAEQLAAELFELKEHEQQPYLSEERKEQIRKQIAYVSFELGEIQK